MVVLMVRLTPIHLAIAAFTVLKIGLKCKVQERDSNQ